MIIAPNDIPMEKSSPTEFAIFQEWSAIIAPAREELQKLAGATEDEFLQIGSHLQDFYQRSSEITSLANQLVDSVSGEQIRLLIDHLRTILGDMKAYLAGARTQSVASCVALEHILELLSQVSYPLENFQKMTKTLRMLGISTKIESSRLGETGLGFLTLAMDVEKLSQLVSEKSSNILSHRQLLSNMIADNLRIVRSGEVAQDKQLGDVLIGVSGSLEELVAVNSRCGSFGTLASSVSCEVSANISEVVSSMQMHDMTRQQIEHIVEALDHLSEKLRNPAVSDSPDTDSQRRLVIEAGDVCELQSAQLRFAASELCSAVSDIAENLRDVANKQGMIASESLSTTGVADSTDGTFMDALDRGMGTITAVLASSARSDRDMTSTLSKVADTMHEVAGFVTDIEEIGTEIDLIALNSQIKAAHTGTEGAALGVLAEAIKRLSDQAIRQTDQVSQALVQINQSTENLFQEATEETEQLGARIASMDHDISGILTELGSMNSNLMSLLTSLGSRVNNLTEDIERVTAAINVHDRAERMAVEIMSVLDSIVSSAREREPASPEFKDNLRHMEERYTMQSERHIHESIARKRSGGTAAAPVTVFRDSAAGVDDSGLGDNVDLF